MVQLGNRSHWVSLGKDLERLNLNEEPLTLSNHYLDRATRGIFKDDLILLGAPTGSGKTQLATNIALKNVEAGKRVHFIALEASNGEIHQRIKYQYLSDFYFRNKKDTDYHYINFSDWLTGKLDMFLGQYEEEAKTRMEQYKNLFIFYGNDNFSVKDLVKLSAEVSRSTDLIIIDHAHYFDFDIRQTENSALKEIAKVTRMICQNLRCPIVLVAHLRKKDRNNKEICPSLEEFHGSSDLTKIATKVITLAGGGLADGSPNRVYTYVRVCKNRYDSSVTKFVAKMVYNYSLMNYEEDFQLMRLTNGGTEAEHIPLKVRSRGGFFIYNPQYPYWCKR